MLPPHHSASISPPPTTTHLHACPLEHRVPPPTHLVALLDDHQVQHGQVGRDDAATHSLAPALTYAPQTKAGETLSETQGV